MDPKTRTNIRNLRIREDTAKYLRNLDPNSAEYIVIFLIKISQKLDP